MCLLWLWECWRPVRGAVPRRTQSGPVKEALFEDGAWCAFKPHPRDTLTCHHTETKRRVCRGVSRCETQRHAGIATVGILLLNYIPTLEVMFWNKRHKIKLHINILQDTVFMFCHEVWLHKTHKSRAELQLYCTREQCSEIFLSQQGFKSLGIKKHNN